jgi:nucleoside-diphosphate-sugar epimerase
MSLITWADLFADHFAGNRALVTGGAGFIGSHLVEALLTLGAEVVVLDDLSGGSLDNFGTFSLTLKGRLEFIEGSILDVDVLRDTVKGCRYVFHQAALGSVPRSVAEPERYLQVNVVGTANVLEAARHAGVQRVMFAASSSAYGDSVELPKAEIMPAQPRSPYAATKVAGEALMAAYSCSYGLDTVSLRYFNIFGPRQNANSAYAAVIAAFAKALGQGQQPIIFGDGDQSRDFTFVDNAVYANLLAARSAGPLEGRAMNVACGKRVTVTELARVMAKMYGRPDLQPRNEAERPGDVKHSLADLRLAEKLIGYKPVVSFEEGLQPTVAWYRNSKTEDGSQS